MTAKSLRFWLLQIFLMHLRTDFCEGVTQIKIHSRKTVGFFFGVVTAIAWLRQFSFL